MMLLPISPLLCLLPYLLLAQVELCYGRLSLPQLGLREWKVHDSALKTRLGPIHAALSAGAISPSEAAEEFSSTVADFLGDSADFKGGEGRGEGGVMVRLTFLMRLLHGLSGKREGFTVLSLAVTEGWTRT